MHRIVVDAAWREFAVITGVVPAGVAVVVVAGDALRGTASIASILTVLTLGLLLSALATFVLDVGESLRRASAPDTVRLVAMLVADVVSLALATGLAAALPSNFLPFAVAGVAALTLAFVHLGQWAGQRSGGREATQRLIIAGILVALLAACGGASLAFGGLIALQQAGATILTRDEPAKPSGR
jgi:hypothetical protein